MIVELIDPYPEKACQIDPRCVALQEPDAKREGCKIHDVAIAHRTSPVLESRNPLQEVMTEPTSLDYQRKWYLAGPMSGIPESNYPVFRSACKLLRGIDYDIVSPHETNPCENPKSEEEYLGLLRHDVHTMAGCTGIILLPGWSKSNGAKLELYIALTLKIPIRFLDGEGVLHDFS